MDLLATESAQRLISISAIMDLLDQQQASWIRLVPRSASVIAQHDYLDFFRPGMEFEDFVYQFAHWYQREHATQVAVLIGLRADE